MPDSKKVDAVLVPANLRRGASAADRVRSIYAVAVPLLAVASPKVREVGGGMYLVTEHADDTLLFPKTHDRAGEPRYTWSDPDPNGVRSGTLRDVEAEEQAAREAAKPRPAAASIPRAAGHTS